MATAIGTYATLAAVEARIGGTFTNAEETLISGICDQVNMHIERATGRILAPISGTPTYTYDGDGTKRLYLPVTGDGTPIGGIRAISTVEVAQYTSAAYVTLSSTQYFLREKSNPAAPYDALYFTDFPTGSFSNWPLGYATVRITATAGWATIPDDIVETANAVAVDIWHKRQVGAQSELDGGVQVGRFFGPQHRDTLRAYTLADRLV